MPDTATRTRRQFTYKGMTLGDPDPTKSIPDVQKMLAVNYPELTSASHTSSTKDGRTIIEFTAAVRTKG